MGCLLSRVVRYLSQRMHKLYCGIDLHARTMYLCIVIHDGGIMVHMNLPTSPEEFLKLMKPYRKDPGASPGRTNS